MPNLHLTYSGNYLNMLDPRFDPYDILANLSERLAQLETQHNKLVSAFEQLENNAKIIEARLRNTESSHVALASHVFKDEIDNLVK